MKVLTVQQPWAWAIIHGGKDVENRTQAWSYRGPLAIHAGARWSDRGAHDLRIARACASSWPIPPADDMLDSTARSIVRHGLESSLYPNSIAMAGAIIGVVDLIDVHQAVGDDLAVCCSSVWGETSYEEHGGRTRREIFHLELVNPRPLAIPIPCRGALGLWTPPAVVLEQLQAVAR